MRFYDSIGKVRVEGKTRVGVYNIELVTNQWCCAMGVVDQAGILNACARLRFMIYLTLTGWVCRINMIWRARAYLQHKW